MRGEAFSGHPHLLVFTETYPYSGAAEETFLEPQLPHLMAEFASVTVVPSSLQGVRLASPTGVIVDETLAWSLSRHRSRLAHLLVALSKRLFWREMAIRPDVVLYPRGLARFVRTAARSATVRDWFIRRARRESLDLSNVVAYSFWCDHTSVGLSLAKQELPALKIVSRVNGDDFVEERHKPPHIPYRHMTLQALDKVYGASEYAKSYLVQRYPAFKYKYEVARLGTSDPALIGPQPQAGPVVVVSCSGIVDVKRVELIVAGVAEAARRTPDRQFEWHHFGDGPLRSSIESSGREQLPRNAKYVLHGNVTLDEIINYYTQTPITAFVNASWSEGGCPVAILEAESCGLPIVAPAVGGIPEIVSDENGSLLDREPGPSAIGSAILELTDAGVRLRKGRNSRETWERLGRADSNNRAFSKQLRSVLE